MLILIMRPVEVYMRRHEFSRQESNIYGLPRYSYVAAILFTIALIAAFVFLARINYVLFHTIAEGFAITVGVTIYFIIWNSKRYFRNDFFYVVGSSFVAIAFIRFLHTIAYKGLGTIFFPSFDPSDLATQLWIAGSMLQAASFLAATLFLRRKIRPFFVIATYLILLSGLLASIFYFRNFPTAFQPGVGLTEFKIFSEYIISGVYVFVIIVLFRSKKFINPLIFRVTIASIICLVLAELAFTLYTDPYGYSNMIGHFFEIAAYYLFYRALIVSTIFEPQTILFKELKESEAELKEKQSKLRVYARKIEDEKNEDEALLKSIGDGIVATDSCGRIIFANDAFIELFGLEHSVVANRNLDTILPLINEQGEKVPFDNRPLGTIIKSVDSKKKVFKSDQFSFISRDKTIIRLLVTASPVLSKGRMTGIISVYRDITREKDLERTKSEFVSFAAHQLRTPLTTIGLTTELLSSRKKIDKDTKENLEELKKDIGIMSRLVNTFLNVSRIETGKINIIPELDDVRPMIKEVVNQVRAQAKEKNIIIEEKINGKIPYIKVDQNIINIIIENLLTNAIKYTPENGNISLVAKVMKGKLLIEVTDSGVGIPRSEQSKAFDRMFRADNVHKHDGAGLGLYLVRSVVRQCGGKVWFESPSPHYVGTEHTGTTFYFSLPLSGMKAKIIKEK